MSTSDEIDPAALLAAAPEPDFDQVVGDPGTGRVTSISGAGQYGMVSAADREALEAAKQAEPPGVKATPILGANDTEAFHELVRETAGMAGNQVVQVIITLKDPPFAWNLLRGRSDAAREAATAVRKNQVSEVQAPVLANLEKIGAKVHAALWIAPSISAEVARKDVDVIASWPEVLSVGLDKRPGATLFNAYGGEEARNGMRITAFINQGYRGQNQARANSSSAMRVAEIERAVVAADFPIMYHLGFSDRYYGFPRFYDYRSCSGTACTPAYSSYATAANHYSAVLKVMTGSIENGIDPNYPNAVDQRRRSGIAPEAYWSIMAPVNLTCSAWIAAVQEAQTTSMDVVNSSDGWDNKCSNTYDCGGLNTALKNAVDAGVVFTASMGNRGDGGGTTCNSAYPAQRRDVLGIGALDTTSTATNYDTTGAASYTSRGGVDITINGVTHSKGLAIADLSAPGDYSYYYNTPTNGYSYATASGTSFSAPSVGGAVALLRQSFRALGFGSTADNARAVMVNMLPEPSPHFVG